MNHQRDLIASESSLFDSADGLSQLFHLSQVDVEWTCHAFNTFRRKLENI